MFVPVTDPYPVRQAVEQVLPLRKSGAEHKLAPTKL